MAWSSGKSFADMVKTNLVPEPSATPESPTQQKNSAHPVKNNEKKTTTKATATTVPFSIFAPSFPPPDGHPSTAGSTGRSRTPSQGSHHSHQSEPSPTTSPTTARVNAWHKPLKLEQATTGGVHAVDVAHASTAAPGGQRGTGLTSSSTSTTASTMSSATYTNDTTSSSTSTTFPSRQKSDGSTSPMITASARGTSADASLQADIAPLERSHYYYAGRHGNTKGTSTHHSMSTATHRSTGTGTQDHVMGWREQGTSTEYPWVPQRDQSTSTRSQHYNKHTHHNNHNDHAKENNKDNPWRRMVMAATSAAQERERIEQGVHPGRTTATTTSAHPPHLHQQRQQPQQQYHQQHQQQYYRSQHSQEYTTTGRGRDYSVIKDTCQELTFELRSFGAYVMAVDQQVSCVLEEGWGTFEPISFIVLGNVDSSGVLFLSFFCVQRWFVHHWGIVSGIVSMVTTVPSHHPSVCAIPAGIHHSSMPGRPSHSVRKLRDRVVVRRLNTDGLLSSWSLLFVFTPVYVVIICCFNPVDGTYID